MGGGGSGGLVAEMECGGPLPQLQARHGVLRVGLVAGAEEGLDGSFQKYMDDADLYNGLS